MRRETARAPVDWDPLSGGGEEALEAQEDRFNPFAKAAQTLSDGLANGAAGQIAAAATGQVPQKAAAGGGKSDDPEQALVNMGNVTFLSANQDVLLGTLRVSNFRLWFEPSERESKENRQWFFQERSLFDLPLGCIDRVSRVSSSQVVGGRGKDSLMLHISCKDFRKLQFRFATMADACKVYDLVRMSAFPLSEGQGLKWLFALEYGRAYLKRQGEPSPGWSVYDPMREWVRQGVFASEAASTSSDYWRVSRVNADYSFCPSYPPVLAVPTTVTDDDLRAVSAFRSKARIPAMTWFNKHNRGSIWRCSQPKVGLGNVSRHDEALWSSILARANSSFARIVDVRPYKNALGNKAKGMGYEDEMRYEKTSISFQGLHNIHVVRGSMEKLHALICSSGSGSSSSAGSAPGHSWLSQVEATGWLNHVRAILNASILVARFVASNGFPVMVHCSDGWDRTSQVSALAQMLADPYFRTIEGFQVLVEKDWLSFGYQFQARTGHGSDSGAEERSPCFLLFVDCAWQLLRQFPGMFEFNEAMLLFVLEHLYSCKFGTFLCDSDRERRNEHALHTKTVSLWDAIDAAPARFRNPLYKLGPCAAVADRPLLPHPTAVNRQVVLWSDYYLRYPSVPSTTGHAFQYLRTERLRLHLPPAHDLLRDSLVAAQAAACSETSRADALQAKQLELRSSLTEATMGGSSGSAG